MIKKSVRKYSLTSIIVFLALFIGYSQDPYQKQKSVDIQDYIFKLSLNDESNEIKGEALITANFKNSTNQFVLDLVNKTNDHGMTVSQVLEGDSPVNFVHKNNKLKISRRNQASKAYKIQYHGVPRKGLVIDTTKFGRRSFFGDNWPNLARHWLPSIDHPYDKASIQFVITAPEDYDVVATGKKIEESNLGNGFKQTVYKENAPVAMKVVTIGVTKFASKLLDIIHDIPVSAWVYPENRLEGFSDYKVASNVLRYFIENIGPYPFAKLANMQAKTQWGGLENSGTIAYFEDSVTGKNTVEGLIAHEIAHQWFGNSATENNWNHVWLSEGFATYFSILYLEHVYGDEKRKDELALDRKQVIHYYKQNPAPIVDLTISDPMKVLSTNSYQKGGWILNMLRHNLGEETFWTGIREYYKTYRDSNVMTKDFRNIMEEVSGKNLEKFFSQWLFTKGHPELKWEWSYDNEKVKINLKQLQKHHIFSFPLEIGLLHDDELTITKVKVDSPSSSFIIKSKEKPDTIILDPNYWLLFEEK